MGARSLVKKVVPTGVFKHVEPYGHLAEAILAQAKNGFPAKGMNIVGVTGTDGKTTTCTLVAKMLQANGYKVAVLTTVSVDYADGRGAQPSPTHMTTASAGRLMAMLKKIKANNPDWVIVETSSHALAQNRVWGIPYSIAVLTNITHEHLDYHGTFQRYQEAKKKLFTLTSRNKKGLQIGIINADDPSCELFSQAIANPVTYGVNDGNLRATSIKLTSGGSRYVVKTEDGECRIQCHLPGRFNVYNSLAAVGVGRAIGLTNDQVEKGIDSVRQVSGRMARVEIDKPYEVIVDYAVTPAALQNVLESVQEVTRGRVAIVFGATGDRDRAKRPVMGEVVAKFADKIYLTDDETYTEDPTAIRAAVYAGIVQAGGADKTQEYDDRKQAIAAALQDAHAGDTIVITGLGHQQDRNMGGRPQPWNDADVVKSILGQK